MAKDDYGINGKPSAKALARYREYTKTGKYVHPSDQKGKK